MATISTITDVFSEATPRIVVEYLDPLLRRRLATCPEGFITTLDRYFFKVFYSATDIIDKMDQERFAFVASQQECINQSGVI